MGIFVVLIFYAIALSILAFAGAIVLGGASYFLTRHCWPRSKRLVTASTLFPFLCVGYAGSWFVTYAVINWAVFHRDPGLGDGAWTPMPNGYSLSMTDTTDQGSIYGSSTSGGQPVVDTVQQLQVSGNLIFGARDEDYFGETGRRPGPAISYFLLNTSDRSKTELASLEQLRQQALSRGVTLKLRAFDEVFSDYRYTWFDVLAAAILFLVPATGFLLLARWIWKTRSTSRPSTQPASAN